MTTASDAEARRRRTIDILESENVVCHPGPMRLPCEGELRIPEAEVIALRALALVLIACEATGLAHENVDGLERHRAFTWLIQGGGDRDDVIARA